MARYGYEENIPTVRILILGDKGVGKKSLKSRFTTFTYPSLYDAEPTLTNTQLLSLDRTRQLNTSHNLLARSLQDSLDTSPKPRRPRSASSTFSNLGSELELLELEPYDTCVPDDTTEQPPSNPFFPHIPLGSLNTHHRQPTHPPTRHPNMACPFHNTTTPSVPSQIQLELTTLPSPPPHLLRNILLKSPHDAILLVYSTTSRPSFTSIASLHAEIPLSIRRKRSRRWGGSLRKARSAIFSGHHHDEGRRNGNGEVVVALVGNKCDVGGEDDGWDSSDGGEEVDFEELEFQRHLMEKEAVLQEADVEERSLVHPLYRDSRLFGGCDDRGGDMPLLPVSPRSVSVRSVPAYGRGQWDGPQVDDMDMARRSVFSDGGVRERVSTFSGGGSLNLVPEGNEHLPSAEKKTPIERWMEGRNLVDGHRQAVRRLIQPHDDVNHHLTNPHGTPNDIINDDLDAESDTTAAPPPPPRKPRHKQSRQVSKLEGELLSRALLLNVPFYETSARTGENIQEVFRAIVIEVLREMGHQPAGGSHLWGNEGLCCCGGNPGVGMGIPTTGYHDGNEVIGKGTRGEPVEGKKKRTLSKRRRPMEGGNEKRGEPGLVSGRQETTARACKGDDDKVSSTKGESIRQPVVLQGLVNARADGSAVTTDTHSSPIPQKKQRRESVLERFKKVFTKKTEVVMSDIAVI